MPSQRAPHVRQHGIWLSTHNCIHFITGLVIAGIFVSETLVKDKASMQDIVVLGATTNNPPENLVNAIPTIGHEPGRTEEKANVLPGNNSNWTEAFKDKLNIQVARKQEADTQRPEANATDERPSSASNRREVDTQNEGIYIFKPRSANGEMKSEHPKIETPARHSSTFSGGNSTDARNETLKEGNEGHVPQTRFRGVQRTDENKHLFKMDNVTHLSFMLYRLVKTHNVKSILEVPCKSSVLWTRDLLQTLEFEIPRFHYKCLVPDDRSLAEAILRFKDLASVVVLKDEHPWASQLPQSDLALTWYGLGFWAPTQSWKLLQALRASKTRYVLVPNFPGLERNPGTGSKEGRVNVRRAPYRFNEPLRVVNNISLQATMPKQLLLYDVQGIRSGLV